jgi:hypothetical protein
MKLDRLKLPREGAMAVDPGSGVAQRGKHAVDGGGLLTVAAELLLEGFGEGGRPQLGLVAAGDAGEEVEEGLQVAMLGLQGGRAGLDLDAEVKSEPSRQAVAAVLVNDEEGVEVSS